MNTLRIIAAIAGLALLVVTTTQMLRVQWLLERARLPHAPPMPAYNWGKFRHLTDTANLQPGSEALAGRYRRLWYSTMLQPLGWIAAMPWLVGWVGGPIS